MKPSIPKGTRDFSATEVAKRRYIFNTIQETFEVYGFQPIETPSFENSSTLMGKYGDEGDRLIFKILNSADYIPNGEDVLKFGKYINDSFTEKFILNFYKSYIKKDTLLSKVDDRLTYELDENDKSIIKSYLTSYINSFNDRKLFKILNSEFKNIIKLIYEIVSIIKRNGHNEIFWKNKFIELKELIFKGSYSKFLTPKISEKALRYDLTVPFARYVVQHQNEIAFPFKRYQIQPVWRADRPQKGRFREFYQCDADVVGSKSLLQEVEFVQLYDAVFSKLGLQGTTIKINNRKILSGIAEVIGAQDKLIDFTVALDKLDKIGEEGVVKEMLSKGISETAIQKVNPLFHFTGSNEDKLASLSAMLQTSEEGTKGVEELRFVIESVKALGLASARLEVDVTLARGLNYYTGAIFEVAAPPEVKMGSIGGGGRYDDLTGVFGLKDVSGVGISFGLDRIYLVMEELGLLQSVALPKPKVLFLNFDIDTNITALKAIKELRKNGIKSELYPDTATSNKQQKKQWKYVSNREIEFVVSKVEGAVFTLKNMINGEQNSYLLKDLINALK